MIKNGCNSDEIATATAAAIVDQNKHVFSVDAAEFIPSWKISALGEVNTVASG